VAEGNTVFRANQQRKILVIDDSEIILEVTRAALEAAGHCVVTHDRAAGCVALILQQKPDLVLMDVNMPHLGGDTIVGVLAKAQPTGDSTVVLLHSSLSADILKVKAEAVGAQGFIQKTGDLFALVREVNRWLKRSSSSKVRVAADIGFPSSGNVRAAAELTTPSSNVRLGAELPATSGAGARTSADLGSPSSGNLRAAHDVSTVIDDEARSATAGSLAALQNGERAAQSGSGLRVYTPSVLLVDRDMAVLSAYRRHLQMQADEFTVEYALSGSAALRSILSDNPPDVAVCEAFMSDLGGLELYRRALASSASWRERMILTSDAQSPLKGPGFTDFKGRILQKPVSGDALRSAVRACLAHSTAAQAKRVTAT
jgi:CheY-like chemotaxis protein